MSHPEQETLQDLAAAYALGALSPEEARRFEAFLAGSPEAQREVAEYREVAALLALGGPGGRARRPICASGCSPRIARAHVRRVPPAAAAAPAGAAGARWRPAWSPWSASASGTSQLREVRGPAGGAGPRGAAPRADVGAADRAGGHAQRDLRARRPDVPAHGQRRSRPAASSSSGTGSATAPSSTGSSSSRCPRAGPTSSGSSRTARRCRRSPSSRSPPGTCSVERIPVPADGEVSAAAVTVEPESGSTQPTSPILLVGPLKRS